MTFDRPQSRNEAILQNMLGAGNELERPQSRIEALLMALLEMGVGGMHYRGVTTTELTDGSTTNPIMIDGEEYTASDGDYVEYSTKEFIWNGGHWGELGDVSEVAARITEAEEDIEDLDARVTAQTMALQALGLTVQGGKLCAVYNK